MIFIKWQYDIILFFIIWKLVLPFIVIVFKYTFGRRFLSKRSLIKKAGEWAIVTGSSSGIGRAYAMELAKDSLNIMLMSNDEKRLNEVATEINVKYKVQTKIIVTDFTKTDIYEEIKAEIDKLPSVACLVNNVGMCYDYLSSFTTAEFINLEFIRRLILCNDLSMATMTHIVLKKMLNQKRSNDAKPTIINIGSSSGINNTPYLSLYSATKAFIYCFGKSLRLETENQAVWIQTVHPSFVQTELSKFSYSSLLIPKPEDYVASALGMFGVEATGYGYVYHAILGQIFRLLPDCFKTWHIRSYAVTDRMKQKRH